MRDNLPSPALSETAPILELQADLPVARKVRMPCAREHNRCCKSVPSRDVVHEK